MATTKVTTDGIDMSGNAGGLVWAKGTTAQRSGSPTTGELRVNTETNRTEVYNGTDWRNLKESAVPTLVDYLVIAGGGSGGMNYGGGGGAGGYRNSFNNETSGGGASAETALAITQGVAYTVTVGAGGASQFTLNVAGNNGSNSVFATITSIGGGAGGASSQDNAGAGGSGGGAGYGSAEPVV